MNEKVISFGLPGKAGTIGDLPGKARTREVAAMVTQSQLFRVVHVQALSSIKRTISSHKD